MPKVFQLLISSFFPKIVSLLSFLIPLLTSIKNTMEKKTVWGHAIYFQHVSSHTYDTVHQMMSFKKCGGLTWTGCQSPTQLLFRSPSSAAQGENIRWKTSWAEIETALTTYHPRQNTLSLGKSTNLQPVKNRPEW